MVGGARSPFLHILTCASSAPPPSSTPSLPLPSSPLQARLLIALRPARHGACVSSTGQRVFARSQGAPQMPKHGICAESTAGKAFAKCQIARRARSKQACASDTAATESAALKAVLRTGSPKECASSTLNPCSARSMAASPLRPCWGCAKRTRRRRQCRQTMQLPPGTMGGQVRPKQPSPRTWHGCTAVSRQQRLQLQCQ